MPKQASQKPNVILIMTDQHRADALGCMGNKIVQSPNIDRLAETGALFENAFVQCPVCMASRAAIHTGRYPRTIRMPSTGTLAPTEVTLAESLKRAGYDTGLFGKLHFNHMIYTRNQGIDRPVDDAGYFLELAEIDDTANRAAAEDPYKMHYGFDVDLGVEDVLWGHYLDWLREVSPKHVKDHIAENWGIPEGGVSYGSSPPAERVFHPLVSDFFNSHMPAELHPSRFIVDRTIDFIKERRDDPFFVHCSFIDPHHPFNAPVPFNGKYPPEDMPVPQDVDYDDLYPESLPDGANRQIKKGKEFPDELWRWCLANYYGMISNIDSSVGRLMDELEAHSLAKNTIVIFTSDHGEYVGDHRLLYKGSLLFDGVIRVPLIFSWGEKLAPGRRIREMVQAIDIYPTVMGLLGLPIHQGVQGRDLTGMLRGKELQGYDTVYCELDTMMDRTFNPSLGIRSEKWKLNYFPFIQNGLLFNLKDDPEERHNLFEDPGYSSIRREMTQNLIDHNFAAKDPLPLSMHHS